MENKPNTTPPNSPSNFPIEQPKATSTGYAGTNTANPPEIKSTDVDPSFAAFAAARK